jgi:hypothetical protein
MPVDKNFPAKSALRPRDIGLILSYRCLANCAHCIYNCGWGWHDWMAEDEVRTALENAKAVWGKGFQLHLTGGEPFLNFPLLLKATQIAHQLNIPVYVETNAGWVKGMGFAEERFQQLRDAGMMAVLVSVSPFHQETIPLEQTLLGISAARSVFGADRVMVYQSEWLPEMTQHGLKEKVPLGRHIEMYGVQQGGLRLWMGFGLISGGRAGYRLGEWIPKRPAESFIHDSCREELLFSQHSHIDLYGNFIPGFCGGISLGDWHALEAVVKGCRMGNHPMVIQELINSGPFALFDMAVKDFGYHPLPKGYAGKCHLCVDVRAHLARQGVFREIFHPLRFYDE